MLERFLLYAGSAFKYVHVSKDFDLGSSCYKFYTKWDDNNESLLSNFLPGRFMFYDAFIENLYRDRQFVIERVYFYYSISFLICRTSALFLFASNIYENSRKPLKITRMVPNDSWTQEVERFNDQIYSETNALSGMNFFYLTRSVLFGLAGTILTYELVMVQYDTTEKEIKAWMNCTKWCRLLIIASLRYEIKSWRKLLTKICLSFNFQKLLKLIKSIKHHDMSLTTLHARALSNWILYFFRNFYFE